MNVFVYPQINFVLADFYIRNFDPFDCHLKQGKECCIIKHMTNDSMFTLLSSTSEEPPAVSSSLSLSVYPDGPGDVVDVV